MRIIITRTALRDVADIWNYIAADNIDAADQARDQIETAIRKLGVMPQIGHVRRDLPSSTLRFWRVRSYLIAYRTHGKTLIVSRVIHGARDLRPLFAKKRKK